MEDKIRKWQEELERVQQLKKELNTIFDKEIKDLKQKIADGQEQVKKEQDQRAAQMVRDTYGDLTPEALGKLRELLEIAENPAENPAEQ